jgi:hypothetical protein
MKALPIVLAALGATVLLGSTTPARADDDGWRRHERHEHEWREHERREYYQPPGYVYVAPPPVVYAPPAVIYAPVPMIGIRLR